MIRGPWSEDERRRILVARREALERYEKLMDRIERSAAGSEEEFETAKAAEAEFLEAERAERAYFAGLPRVAVSCCPFDGKPVLRSFDPYGEDGIWWKGDGVTEESPSCPHFCFWRGAREGTAVSVIPRILEKAGVFAVLSRIEMSSGAVVSVVSYFAERRPAAEELAGDWPRGVYTFVTALGKHRWHHDEGGRDIDLGSWLARGKIRWCEVGSGNEKLSEVGTERCPHIGLAGEEKYGEIIIAARRIRGAQDCGSRE